MKKSCLFLAFAGVWKSITSRPAQVVQSDPDRQRFAHGVRKCHGWRMLIGVLLCAGLLATSLWAGQKLEAEVVSLRNGGFSPAKITRPAGQQFLLVIKNRAGTDQMTLSIAHNNGLSVEASATIKDLDQDYLLNLTAGTYTLTDSSHPKWTPLTIVVQ